MCGIFAIFGLPEPGVNWREEGLRNNSKCSFLFVLYESINLFDIDSTGHMSLKIPVTALFYELEMAYLNLKKMF